MRPPRSRSNPVLFLLVTVVVSPASAGTITWSGPASPCGSTLQACINGAAAGDIVEVATNLPINEDITINKSLELTAAPGFAPVIGDLHFVQLLNPAPLSNRIRFEYFTLTRGFVSAVQNSNQTFDVGIQHLTIQNTFNSRPAIEVRNGQPGPFGPLQVGIVGNRVTIPPNSQPGPVNAISVEGGNAVSLLGLIQQNRIDHFDGGQDGGIAVFNVEADLDVTVVANEIRGSAFNNGVRFFQFGEGSSTVRFLDNLVVGQTTESGVPGSYAILADAGTTAFEIVNNTAVEGNDGIIVVGRDDLGATWSGVVANNIVSGMTGAGMALFGPVLTPGVVENDHNLTFDVGFNNFTPGPGTLSADPLFVGGGDFRLTDPSPARNSGNDARVPVDLATDLDGNPRIVGGRVDMGAYESSSLVTVLPASLEQVRLHPNTPNPFRTSTVIHFELPRPGPVWVGVFDVQGRLVRWLVPGTSLSWGPQQFHWDGRDAEGRAMAPGVYFCRLETGETLATRRMVLLR
jgi:hypothetical protein